MAVASWRPALWVQCAFNANPNDPSVVANWSDLSSPFFVGADQIQRGRQYELDQNRASQPTFSFLDQSEYLNPANTSSPYYPNVVPLRQILMQAMWPNQATGNLMNANQGTSSILGTTSAGYDPSFDSYTAGSTVPWITAVGGVTPTVGTTTPHSGANDLTYTVSTAATEQGVTWTVPAVPGQQYTASAYVRQSSASTQTITVGGLTAGIDAFDRTSSNGWGTADVGGSWTTTGGAAGDYSTLPGDLGQGVADVSHSSVNVARMTTLAASGADCDVTAYVSVPVIATGAAIRMGVVGRWTSASNLYRASADFNTDSSVTFRIWKRVAGAETSLASTTMSFPYSVDTQYGIRLKVQGTNLSASMWQQTGSEPSSFTLTATDSALTGAGQVGCWSRLETGNTNSTPVLSYYNFGATYTASGSTTSATGAYNRISATFTATAPTHTIGVLALTGATAGTVLVDDVQYEQGASANTFTTTGPTIYGVFRGYVERWPSQWTNGGFLGHCTATGVDAFEPLNLYTLNSDYYQQVLTLKPDLYWPLNDAAGSTTFGEQSGNNGITLTKINSKTGGPAQTFAAGSATNIPGDPSGTGVEIIGTFPAGSALQGGGASAFVFSVGASAPPWTLSTAFWFTSESTNAGFLLTIFNYITPTNQPIAMYVSQGPSVTQVEMGLSGPDGTIDSHDVNSALFDGNPHLVVGTVNFASTSSCTYALWVDGSQLFTRTINPTTTFGSNLNFTSTTIQVGGDMGIFFTDYDGQTGTYSHVALWERVLSSTEIGELWTAGGLGNAGETSGTRIARYVASAWSGLTNIDSGNAIMGISTVTTGQGVLEACQAVNVSEQGNFYADKDGQVTFVQRDVRYLATTSLYTFGDGAGEYPYIEDIEYDLDPTYIFNTVVVNNADGTTATVTNNASQKSYFPRSNTLSADLQSDDDAIQTAYFILNKHDQPTQRIASITLDPAGNQDLWAVILSLEIGMRVTVKRRPKAANGGAGITMSGDFFIENINHHSIDMAAGTWQTTLLLSPAVETSSVFIFDDATYGQFDGVGVFAL